MHQGVGGTAGSGTSSVEEPRGSPARMEGASLPEGAQAAAFPDRPGTERLVARPEEYQEVRFRRTQARIQTGGCLEGRCPHPDGSCGSAAHGGSLAGQPPSYLQVEEPPSQPRATGPVATRDWAGVGGQSGGMQAGWVQRTARAVRGPKVGHIHTAQPTAAQDGCPNSWRAGGGGGLHPAPAGSQIVLPAPPPAGSRPCQPRPPLRGPLGHAPHPTPPHQNRSAMK